jgi:molybdopterin/thiamine biosynthesis adenylyltransferase
MPDFSFLAERRENAIVELDRFLQNECGAIRLPDAVAGEVPLRGYIVGWELALQCSEQVRRLHIYIDSTFPFSVPHFLLVDRPPFLTWPHIEPDGVLCLASDSVAIDSTQPSEVARRLFVEGAFPLIEECETGRNRDDLRSEFHSYWNYDLDGELPIWSLLDPHGPSRQVRVWRGQGISVVGETELGVLSWLRKLYGNKKSFESAQKSCLLWLDRPLLPSEYPKRAADVWRLAGDVESGQELLESVADAESSSFRLVLGAMSNNGPCFASLGLSAPIVSDVRGQRHRDPINDGFRTGHLPQSVLAQRVFNTSQSVSRGRVERADRSWIHGRDQDGRQNELRTSRIAIIGCGSIGGAVAKQLAMAGAGDILLIDPELLSWSNVGRHILGANYVTTFKATTLQEELQRGFPHSKFSARTDKLEQVLEVSPELLRDRNLILCATGNWSVEGLLNTWHFNESEIAHIVYAWTEPNACAGQAVAIRRGSSCFQCGMSSRGDAKVTVTSWPESRKLLHEPACGAVYQPYGPVELTWTTTLASSLVLDCLLGKISESTHRVWAGPRALLHDAGGEWSPDWIGGKAERECGGFLEERAWGKDANCAVCNTLCTSGQGN